MLKRACVYCDFKTQQNRDECSYRRTLNYHYSNKESFSQVTQLIIHTYTYFLKLQCIAQFGNIVSVWRCPLNYELIPSHLCSIHVLSLCSGRATSVN